MAVFACPLRKEQASGAITALKVTSMTALPLAIQKQPLCVNVAAGRMRRVTTKGEERHERAAWARAPIDSCVCLESGPMEEIGEFGNEGRKLLDEALMQELFSAVYEELRRIARAMKWFDGSSTNNPTAMVHEAYLRLAGAGLITIESEQHFKHLVVLAMRRILCEAARRRNANKRGGKELVMVSIDDTGSPIVLADRDLSAMFDGLEDLGRIAPRLAAVVDYRVIGGWSNAEIAAFLGLSETTVRRDWRAARAWLMQYARNPRQGGSRA